MTPASAATEHASGHLAHTAHVLSSINWWAWDSHRPPMGWFLLDFVAFVGLLIFFAAKPLRNALTERHESIRRAVTDAAASHARATASQQAWSRKLAGLDAEVRELETASLRDGEAELARAVADAEARAQRLRDESALLTTQETRRSHERLRKRLLADAIALAQSLLTQNLTADDQQHLAQRAIDEMATAKPRFGANAKASEAHP